MQSEEKDNKKRDKDVKSKKIAMGNLIFMGLNFGSAFYFKH